mgnify:CR=1 FL=1
MISIEHISQSLHETLAASLNPTLVLLAEMTIAGVLVISLFAVLGLVLVFMERKVSAYMQIRLGPNRVGYKGFAQTAADTLKLLIKEGLTPDGADKFLFNFAPLLVIIVAMLIMAPIAFTKGFQLWDINIGVLYVSAVSSVSVIGILMAGWASNNKYSLLGSMRASSQMISYEVSIGLILMAVIMCAGSLNLTEIVLAQREI